MTYAQELAQLSTEDFFKLIDRNTRNENLEFADVCSKRSDEELLVTLRHWQGQEGSRATRLVAIVRGEILERMGLGMPL